MNLRQFLFRKRTLAVAGALVVMMVGVGVWLRSNVDWKRERIELSERLLDDRRGSSQFYTFSDAIVTQDSENQFTIKGNTDTNYRKGYSTVPFTNLYIELIIKKSDGDLMRSAGEWYISSKLQMDQSCNKSLWDRIKRFVTSNLP